MITFPFPSKNCLDISLISCIILKVMNHKLTVGSYCKKVFVQHNISHSMTLYLKLMRACLHSKQYYS